MSDNVCLLIVDVQYDFLPGGALEVPDGDMILNPIMELVPLAGLVIASRDWHPENHFSFAYPPEYVDGSWPPHCVQGTRGAKLFPAARKYANYVISKGTNRHPPDDYSAFTAKTLRPVLSLREILDRSPIDTIIVTGLPLDITVRYTALDANALGYKTIVPLDATQALGEASRLATLSEFERAGIHVVQSSRELHLQDGGELQQANAVGTHS